MSHQHATWAPVSIDKGAAKRTFLIEQKWLDELQRVGLSIVFESEAFSALNIVRERLQLSSEGVWDVDRGEDFELSQGPAEGLPKLWYLEWQVRAEVYLVTPMTS